MTPRTLLAFGLLAAAATLAQALELRPYTPAALAQAQDGGRPAAILFHATWCPTCRAQEQALQAMRREPGLDLTVFLADYDTEQALKRQFAIRSQSTLVALRGHKVTARLIGDTSPDGLRVALKSAL